MGVTGQSLPPKNDFEHERGLRISAYAVNLTYETYRHTYIHIFGRAKRAPHWGVQSRFRVIYVFNIYKIFNPSEWNIRLYCTKGRKISRGRRPRKIFSTEGTIYADISQGRVLNILFIT